MQEKVKIFTNLLLYIIFISVLNAQDTSRIQLLLDKSMGFKNSDLDSMIYYGRVAKLESESISWQPGISQAYSRLGLAYSKQGENDSAHICYLKSIRIREETGPPVKLASSYMNMAVFFKNTTVYDSSAYYFKLALEQATLGQDENQIADIKMSWASLLKRMKDFDEAGKMYFEVEAMYKKTNKPENLADINFNIANYFDEIGNSSQATLRYNTALYFYTQTNNIDGKAKCYNGLGVINFRKKNYIEARKYFSTSISLKKQLGIPEGVATSLINLGDLETEVGNYSQAEIILREAITYSKNANDNEGMKNAFENLIVVYASTNNKNGLLDAIQKSDSLQQKILDEAKQKEIVTLNAKYKLEENEIRIKNEEIKNQKLEIENKNILLTKRIFLISSLSLALLSIIITILLFQQRRLTRRKSQLAQQQIESLLNDQELKSINAMIEGQDNERKRIAEDLHDRVGSILSTVKLYFGSLNTKIDTYQDENKKQYEQANTLLDEAVQEVRRISHNLISGILMKFGLVPALKDLCDTVEGTQQLKINLKVFNVDERMDGQMEISIYRIIQELLSNVLKHAKATEITISLTRNDGNLNIIVEDNGKGFDTNMNFEGIGLKNIRSRVEKLNGQVKFDSVIDRGTTVIIDLPVDETPNDV